MKEKKKGKQEEMIWAYKGNRKVFVEHLKV